MTAFFIIFHLLSSFDIGSGWTPIHRDNYGYLHMYRSLWDPGCDQSIWGVQLLACLYVDISFCTHRAVLVLWGRHQSFQALVSRFICSNELFILTYLSIVKDIKFSSFDWWHLSEMSRLWNNQRLLIKVEWSESKQLILNYVTTVTLTDCKSRLRYACPFVYLKIVLSQNS